MLFKDSPEKFWNLISSMYASKPIPNEDAYRGKIEIVKSYLSPDQVVLDIGCGTGTQCLDLSGHIQRAIGIDISEKLLAIAKQRKTERNIENVDFVKTSVFDQQFMPESFDVVMAFYVFHFFPDIHKVFTRVNELLKPGGLFISESPCLGDRSNLSRKLVSFLGQLGLMPPLTVFTQAELEEALQKSGFEIIKKKKFCEAQDGYTLIARKQ